MTTPSLLKEPPHLLQCPRHPLAGGFFRQPQGGAGFGESQALEEAQQDALALAFAQGRQRLVQQRLDLGPGRVFPLSDCCSIASAAFCS